MKCLFLYNPAGGRGLSAKRIAYIRRRLETKYTVDVVETSSPQDLEERVRGAAGYDAVVFSGGDGTFNNVLQGIGDSDVQLGYLPTGTVNDVAHTLGIPRGIGRALKVILGGRSERVDCMRINGSHYVMYIAAAGTLTQLTYETRQTSKRAFGWFAYVFHGLFHNLRFRVFHISAECGEERFELPTVLTYVMNGRSIAGFIVNRKGHINDGVIEFAALRQVERPGFFRKVGAFLLVVWHMFFGLRKSGKHILYKKAQRVRIETEDDVVWDFDGEKGIAGSIDVEVVPKKVRIFIPKNKKL